MKRFAAFLSRFGIFIVFSTAIYFYWGTTSYEPGHEPIDYFPVVVQSPDSDHPAFLFYRWSELKELRQKEPGLSLALPVGEHRIVLEPNQGFTPTVHFQVAEDHAGQRIKVTHSTDDYIFQSVYQVSDNVIQPVRLRIAHGMIILGAVFLGSVATVFFYALYSVAKRISKRRVAQAA